MATMNMFEAQRLLAQQDVDASKTFSERNRLGQYATPSALAEDMLTYALSLLPKRESVRFLEPGFGTGAFYSALLRVFPRRRIAKAVGFEIDPQYGERAAELWSSEQLDLRIEDFTAAIPPASEGERFNLVISNPPYVRHHHLSQEAKQRLKQVLQAIGTSQLNGLAGLYCYFLLIAHQWMAKGALAGWLIPSEFMDVNYGKRVKGYLLDHVTLLHIHRFNPEDVQFGDALVSSAVVWFRNAPPPKGHTVTFTYGGSLFNPARSEAIPIATLRDAPKWTRFPIIPNTEQPLNGGTSLSELFTIKRGIATGANDFFVLTEEEIRTYDLPREFLKPVLPSPRYVPADEIMADEQGLPLLDPRYFLLSCDLPEEAVRTRYPALWTYLQRGIDSGVHEGYLCRHRTPWYAQEVRPATSLLCTYMGRKAADKLNPFRFVLNHSNATALNVYLLLYPKPNFAERLNNNPLLVRRMWETLNEIPVEALVGEGRVYGGGLHKLEPKELLNVRISLPELEAT